MLIPDLQNPWIVEEFYSGKRSFNTEAERYSRDEIIARLRDAIRQLGAAVEVMAPAQIAYRLPGTPEGLDASGDETHFDTSELITHVVSALRFYARGIGRAFGQPMPRFPPKPEGVKLTGKTEYMGSYGWGGLAGEELVELLRDTAERFFSYLQTMPGADDPQARSRYVPFNQDLTVNGWLLMALVHTAVHLKQLREMQSQPDYPE